VLPQAMFALTPRGLFVAASPGVHIQVNTVVLQLVATVSVLYYMSASVADVLVMVRALATRIPIHEFVVARSHSVVVVLPPQHISAARAVLSTVAACAVCDAEGVLVDVCVDGAPQLVVEWTRSPARPPGKVLDITDPRAADAIAARLGGEAVRCQFVGEDGVRCPNFTLDQRHFCDKHRAARSSAVAAARGPSAEVGMTELRGVAIDQAHAFACTEQRNIV
jgi:hypothetical protein